MSRDIDREIAAVRAAGARAVRQAEEASKMAREARAARLAALHRAAVALAAPVAPERTATEALFVAILRAAAQALGGREGRLVLAADPAWDALVPPGGDDAPPEGNVVVGTFAPLRRQDLRGGGATRHVLATGERVMLPDLERPSPFGSYAAAHPHLVERGIRASALVPLRTDGRVIGVLSVNFEAPRELAPDDWEALELFAAHAAAAVERVRVALAERLRERRFHAMVEHSHEAVALLGSDGTVRYVSSAAGRLFGHPPAALVGQTPEARLHADDIARARADFRGLLGQPGESQTGEYRYRRSDGAWRWVSAAMTNLLHDPAVEAVVVNYRDVTDRREREEAQSRRLRQTEQVSAILARIGAAADVGGALAALAHGALALLGGEQGGVRVFDVDGRGTRLAFRIASDGALVPNRVLEPPRGSIAEDIRRGGPARLIDDLLALPCPSRELEEVRRRRAVSASVAVPLDVDGRRFGSLHIDHPEPGFFGPEDLALAEALAAQAGAVIARARVEAARRESEARYRQLVELSPDAIAVHQDGRFVYVNAAGVRLLGAASADELIGQPVLRFVHPDAIEQVRERLHRLAEGEPAPLAVEPLVRLDGSLVEAEIAASPVSYQGAPAVQVIARDITERRRLEAEHAERLRLDGALLVARTVAHELNNALSPVVGFAELLDGRPGVAADPTAAAYVGTIREAAARTAERIQRLQRITRLEQVDSPLGPDQSILDLERSTAPAAT